MESKPRSKSKDTPDDEEPTGSGKGSSFDAPSRQAIRDTPVSEPAHPTASHATETVAVKVVPNAPPSFDELARPLSSPKASSAKSSSRTADRELNAAPGHQAANNAEDVQDSVAVPSIVPSGAENGSGRDVTMASTPPDAQDVRDGEGFDKHREFGILNSNAEMSFGSGTGIHRCKSLDDVYLQLDALRSDFKACNDRLDDVHEATKRLTSTVSALIPTFRNPTSSGRASGSERPDGALLPPNSQEAELSAMLRDLEIRTEQRLEERIVTVEGAMKAGFAEVSSKHTEHFVSLARDVASMKETLASFMAGKALDYRSDEGAAVKAVDATRKSTAVDTVPHDKSGSMPVDPFVTGTRGRASADGPAHVPATGNPERPPRRIDSIEIVSPRIEHSGECPVADGKQGGLRMLCSMRAPPPNFTLTESTTVSMAVDVSGAQTTSQHQDSRANSESDSDDSGIERRSDDEQAKFRSHLKRKNDDRQAVVDDAKEAARPAKKSRTIAKMPTSKPKSKKSLPDPSERSNERRSARFDQGAS